MKSSLLASVSTISLALVAVPVQAADLTDPYLGPAGLPAVSAPNWKFGIAGGLIDLESQSTDGRVHAEGSVSIPLTFSTGLQIDGMIGDLGGDTTGSIGGHLFYRDPTYVLLGVWGGYHGIGSNDIVRFGPEAAFYLDNVTVEGTVGWEDSDSEGSDAYAHVNAAMYPNDDLKVYLGYRRTLGRDAAAAGFEWLTGHQLGFEAPMSLFAEGQVGEDDHSTVWVGLRFYLGGEDKSLIRRHREDDPTDPAPGLSQLAGSNGQQCIPFISEDSVSEFDSCGNLIKTQRPSDRRLKTDICYLDTLPNGLKLYAFRYRWSPTSYVGLMAQDLLAHGAYRHAVRLMPGGHYAVDYEALGLRMATEEEWTKYGMAAVGEGFSPWRTAA